MTSLTAISDGRVIYAGSPDGLYRSDDGGQTWGATSYRGSALVIDGPVDILRERFARGEITIEQFEASKRALV